MILDFELFADDHRRCIVHDRAHREMAAHERARRQQRYRPKGYWLRGELWRASR
jgi:hypothetical protein